MLIAEPPSTGPPTLPKSAATDAYDRYLIDDFVLSPKSACSGLSRFGQSVSMIGQCKCIQTPEMFFIPSGSFLQFTVSRVC